jgi:carboxylesterase type B
MYEFAWRSPQFGGRLGACHGLDVGFVFDAPSEAFEPLVGPSPPRELASLMHAAWIGFARGGDPGWPCYELPRRATMRFDTRSEIVYDPRAMERKLWEGVR